MSEGELSLAYEKLAATIDAVYQAPPVASVLEALAEAAAGAPALAAAAALKLQDMGAAVPGAIVLLSPWADISETGDTYQTLKNADIRFTYSGVLKSSADAYVDAGQGNQMPLHR